MASAVRPGVLWEIQPKLTLNTVLPAAIALRKAAKADRAFCESLFIEAQQGPLQSAGWDTAQSEAYLRPQFAMREQSLREKYPQAELYITMFDSTAVGRLFVERRADAIHIIDIALLENWRRRGIGRYLLQLLRDEADTKGRTISLHVAYDNPAIALYRRFGFVERGNPDVYLFMQRTAASRNS